jgi:hypothetical protein
MSPRLEALIDKVVIYLKGRPQDEEIVPRIVGKATGETELAAMTALSLLEKQGITEHHFGLYCGNTNVPLGSYDDLDDVPQCIPCEVCDAEHCASENDCSVEVYFTVNGDKLAKFRIKAPAA